MYIGINQGYCLGTGEVTKGVGSNHVDLKRVDSNAGIEAYLFLKTQAFTVAGRWQLLEHISIEIDE